MPLLTQYCSFFVSPFGEASVCDELNRFLSSHRIVNIEKRLVDGERGTGWIFLIEFGGESKGGAEQQGIPVYAVFNNEQLAAMVKKPPRSLKDILALPGVGESRVKQFGDAFLKVFAELYARAPDETSRPPV